jgi:hypothetical protein
MTAPAAVILTCGHSHIVSHDSGGRLISCRECPNRDVVQAVKIVTIQYNVANVPAGLFDDITEVSDVEFGG